MNVELCWARLLKVGNRGELRHNTPGWPDGYIFLGAEMRGAKRLSMVGRKLR